MLCYGQAGTASDRNPVQGGQRNARNMRPRGSGRQQFLVEDVEDSRRARVRISSLAPVMCPRPEIFEVRTPLHPDIHLYRPAFIGKVALVG